MYYKIICTFLKLFISNKVAFWVGNFNDKSYTHSGGVTLPVAQDTIQTGTQLGFSIPFFGTSYTNVSLYMDYGFSMGNDDNPNAKVFIAYHQAFSNTNYGQFVYDVAPTAADLATLGMLTSSAFSADGCFIFRPTNGFVATWWVVQDEISVQVAVITNGTFAFLVYNYALLTLDIKAGYQYNKNNEQFTPVQNKSYFYQIHGPQIRKALKNSNTFFNFISIILTF
jgi:hypothetical protein